MASTLTAILRVTLLLDAAALASVGGWGFSRGAAVSILWCSGGALIILAGSLIRYCVLRLDETEVVFHAKTRSHNSELYEYKFDDTFTSSILLFII